jgi:tetratricopeptide (TPR) repeat protein
MFFCGIVTMARPDSTHNLSPESRNTSSPPDFDNVVRKLDSTAAGDLPPAANWVYYTIITAVTLLMWAHTTRFQFVWDDTNFITNLESIRSLKNVPQMFTSLAAQSSFPQGFVLFRPLRTLHYALLYWAGGKDAPVPWVYHLANVLWHCLAALLVFAVSWKLFRRQADVEPTRALMVACLIALGFAVQPVVSEVVCWAKSLDDLMATVFTLAATLALLDWNGKNKKYGWAMFYFLLAVYSKESAVPFVAVAVVIFRKIHQLQFKQVISRTIPFLVIAMLFLIHRHLVIGRTSQTAPISGSYAQTLFDMLPVVPKYLRLLCGIPPFLIAYDFLPGHYSLFEPLVWLGIFELLALIGLGAVAWRYPSWMPIIFGLLWLGLFLLPVSNLVPMMQYMAERFLYLPLIGWLLALGAVLLQASQKKIILLPAAALVLIWMPLAWHRALIWKDPVTLFVQTCQQGPRTRAMEQNAIDAILHSPQVEEVIPTRGAEPQSAAITAPSREKQFAALRTLEAAQQLFPEYEDISIALGIVHARLGENMQAIRFFQQATRQRPGSAHAWSSLGLACLDVGEKEQARAALEKALAIEPDRIEALRSASRVYWLLEDFPAALIVLRKLNNLEPNDPAHAHWISEAEARIAASTAPPQR